MNEIDRRSEINSVEYVNLEYPIFLSNIIICKIRKRKDIINVDSKIIIYKD